MDDTSKPDPLTEAARRLLATHIQLIADGGGSDSALADELAESNACRYLPAEHGESGHSYVHVIFDTANCGESSAHPHLRKPSFQQQHFDRSVAVSIMARNKVEKGIKSPFTELPNDVMWVLFDGGRSLETGLLKAFKDSEGKKAMPKSKTALTITYDEESMIENIGRSGALGSLRCAETCYLVSANDIQVRRKKRAHYKGSNFADTIGPVLVEPWDSPKTWKMSRKDKRAMLGRFKIEVGGSVEGRLASTSKWKNLDVEPTWFHSKPWFLCDELSHSYNANSFIDFTPHSGPWAMVAVRRRIPYVGVCCSTFHVDTLSKHLLANVIAAMSDPADALYRPDLAPSKVAQPEKKKPKTTGESVKKPGAEDGATNNKAALMNRLKDLLKKKGTPDTKEEDTADAEEDEDDPEEEGDDAA